MGLTLLCLFLPLLATSSQTHWATDDSGAWHSAGNWSSGVPGPGDDVRLDRPLADPTIWLHDGDDYSIGSLVNAETLAFAGGSLTLTAGVSTSPGAWDHPAGLLTVANPGTTFTAQGPTNLHGGSLQALAGGVLIASGAAGYQGRHGVGAQLLAHGAGSQLDLAALTSFAGSDGGSQTKVRAESGGCVALGGLTSITRGATVIEALGAGSLVDLALMEAFSGDPASGALSGLHANGATIETPRLTSLHDAYLQVDGSGSIDTRALASVHNASFHAGFGRLELPALTEFTMGAGGVSQILPVGATGEIAFPALTALTAEGGTVQAWALAAGSLDLSALKAATGGALDVRADNWDSMVDLSSLTGFHPAPGGGFLRATSGGLIRLNPSGTTTVTNTIVELTPLGTIEVGTLILGAGSRLTRIGPLSGHLTNAAGTIDPHKLLAGEQLIEGSLTQQTDGVFRVDLGGPTPGTEYDVLTVTGSANLAGTLVVNRIDGFVPAYGDEFRILNAADVSGTLAIAPPGDGSTGIDAGTPHLVFATFYEASGLDLRVVLAGDANADGLVSGADYTRWSDHFGELGAGYGRGDFNSDGVVSGADFTLWGDHFGAVAPEARAVAVPEPEAIRLAVAVGAVALLRLRPQFLGNAKSIKRLGT